MKATKSIRPFSNALRKEGGWTKDWHQRGGGVATTCYTKVVGPRTLELQLWGDGEHRVSFWEGGRMTTTPTDFTTIEGMADAIRYESSRPRFDPKR